MLDQWENGRSPKHELTGEISRSIPCRRDPAAAFFAMLPALPFISPVDMALSLHGSNEVRVRFGIFTGRGHGELIRSHFGPGWAWISAIRLVIAVIGSLMTEFTGIAGVGKWLACRAP